MVDPSYLLDARPFRNRSLLRSQAPFLADGSPGEIRTPVGRSLLPLGDPEPTRDAIDIWPKRPCYARPLHHRATEDQKFQFDQ
jgi:hypothetical protein